MWSFALGGILLENDVLFCVLSRIELLSRLGSRDSLTPDEQVMLARLINELAADAIALIG